jgi:hypothetical protein
MFPAVTGHGVKIDPDSPLAGIVVSLTVTPVCRQESPGQLLPEKGLLPQNQAVTPNPARQPVLRLRAPQAKATEMPTGKLRRRLDEAQGPGAQKLLERFL